MKDTKRVFLTKEELTALEEKQFSIDRLDQVRDVGSPKNLEKILMDLLGL
ncbi:MAG: hypothetical protein WD824_20320 [Cyclobacteriaceae bacterium]